MDTNAFANELIKVTGFFAGVPDSLLKYLCAELERLLPENNFKTTANEGSAVALSAGYTLASGKPGCVYMQNSGLGNAINPLLSLNDPLVYGIPVLMIIGWRGQAGVKDEPQHKKQGIVTEELLKACDIPYQILSGNLDEAVSALKWAEQTLLKSSAPVALLAPKDIFEKTSIAREAVNSLKRWRAIEILLDCVKDKNVCIISTTGMISRELYELREKRGESRSRDFLTVGSMGHASQIALGIAMQKPETTVICLDGDGAAIMHMGAMPIIGASGLRNYIHIVLNNEAHDSVGGHATCAGNVDWKALADSCGYTSAFSVAEKENLAPVMENILSTAGTRFLEVKVMRGELEGVGRPTQTPMENKRNFII